ncbi:MAG: hypothetical protein BRC59_06770 [Cyanobacteria bacterium SW_4_48_29]|nr:MAG: hypothetical protein BRC52_05285 [Cyanobacteria bacterium SW_5_48_44]PSP29854.1 MAG: hypothetical protein BRC59_06770 [Cyanobacteria bacterium SW_4_48_29]
MFIALAGEEIVGTVQFVPEKEDRDLADGKSTAYLQALEVCPKHRQQGIGARLIKVVESKALKQGFEHLSVSVEPDNQAVLNLYQKIGLINSSALHTHGKEENTLAPLLLHLLQKRGHQN